MIIPTKHILAVNALGFGSHIIKLEPADGKNNKYQYQAYVNDIIGSFKDHFILAYMNDNDSGSDMLTEVRNKIVHSVVPIRPDRSILRPVMTRKMKFYHNCKLNC